MAALELIPRVPEAVEVDAAEAAAPLLREYLAHHSDPVIRIGIGEGEQEVVLPRSAVDLLARVLTQMAQGRGATVVPADAELTTQQAADLLNVSRPFLIGLLEADEIAYRKVGKHRRVRAQSLFAYLARDDQSRRDAAEELTRMGREMNLY